MGVFLSFLCARKRQFTVWQGFSFRLLQQGSGWQDLEVMPDLALPLVLRH